MVTRSYLIGIGIATALTLAAWLLILFYFDPNTSGIVGLVLFFLSLSTSLAGLLTIIFYVIRRYFSEDRLGVLIVSLRQGTVLGLVIATILLFKALGVLAWWNAGAMILVAAVLEIYFRVK